MHEDLTFSFLNKAVKGTALVVDDTRINRLLLGKILGDIGYQVVHAENGEEAVEVFKQQPVDIVFMDILMPVMDGYQATTEIKKLCGSKFVPVLFVTAQNEVDALVKCIASGGDDILFKPVHQAVLKAKALGFERTKAIYNEISRLHNQLQEEEELAERVFSSAVANSYCADRELLVSLNSASTFSGDVVLAEYRPNGDIHLLLGDFTGHGLRAAIGAMPVADIFRGMTRKGYTADAILRQINKRLHRLLPTGMFMAGTFVEASLQQKSLTVWNGGMPELLIYNTQQQAMRERLISESLPLGIQTTVELNLKTIPWLPNDHIVLLSDGVTEAVNIEGEMFGEQRLEAAFNSRSGQPSFIACIQQQLERFCNGAEQLDDISMVEIPDLLNRPNAEAASTFAGSNQPRGKWRWQLCLDVNSLQQFTPIPLLMTTLQELSVHQTDRNILFTIVSELFNNAFEHGVLGLESSIKTSAEGFEEYYRQRKRRAKQLSEGWVNITIDFDGQASRQFTIEVSDSGKGFDLSKTATNDPAQQYSGRGLKLVESLCESLDVLDKGTKVSVIYRCQH
ncbi:MULTISPECIES: fused response regulator/phosphatase [unclassified Agarivorans]|uniref:fused response regulator/phosphatase n=1 Tax=unclassified Agarivorans TaxID=2636026 RepID=UPI0026E32814|nr:MULTISPECIES: fused response regulator/phosphatase [unclassified Agarivorans]MDO6688120.1 fused response regulator/phosphatase [Agarivorans sp. 3_MG-2023]MDO6717750.1 fused response regulator/phosphatase [Agarivorans sp. 2_MG-2023]